MCVDPTNCGGQCPECTDPIKHASWCYGNGATTCWTCDGEGSFHDCGEDCCACLEPEPNVDCERCGGSGIIKCPACGAAERAWSDEMEAKADAASY